MYSFQISWMCVASVQGNSFSKPIRRATSMICQVSLMASPGGASILSKCWVRRSELPNMPSRSIHIAAGNTTSATSVVGVG